MKQAYYILIFVFLSAISCCTDPTINDSSLEAIPFSPILYKPQLPAYFPAIINTTDNALTQEGIELGRALFFDPILSKSKKYPE